MGSYLFDFSYATEWYAVDIAYEFAVELNGGGDGEIFGCFGEYPAD